MIGDPNQIPPIVAVPKVVVRRLQQRHQVDDSWSPIYESAQTIADRTMDIGSLVGDPDDPDNAIWTGIPLRAHRRCIDPMFTIANKVAYAGQMVQADISPAAFDCVLGESKWYDVVGTNTDRHVVREEIAKLAQLIAQLRDDWPVTSEGDPAVAYVITPFRRVANEARPAVRSLGCQHQIDVGAVHTFQGKEAEIVFLVLGSAPGPAGSGSREWVVSAPNIITSL